MAALYCWSDVRDVPLLIAALTTPDERVREVVALALGNLGDERAVLPLIDTLEQSKESGLVDKVGRAAARSLGRLGDARAVDALVQALPRPAVHQAAVDALRDIGDPRAVEPLISSMRSTKNPSIATVLGNLGDHRAVEPLLVELAAVQQPRPETGNERRWREIYFYYLIRALGKLGDPRAVPHLEWIAEHETTPVLKGKSLSAMAKRALERIQEQRGPDA